MTHLMQSHAVGQDYLRKRSWIIELSTIEVSMVMHMSRHQKGYGVRREGKMGGGIRERAKETSVPFPLLSFSPPPVPPLICAWHAGYWQSQVQWNHRCISCAFPCMRLSPVCAYITMTQTGSTLHFFVLALILALFDYASHMQLWKLRERRIQHAHDPWLELSMFNLSSWWNLPAKASVVSLNFSKCFSFTLQIKIKWRIEEISLK